GQAFAFGNTSALNSRNPFVTEQPGYHSIFSSGNIGGPIGKKTAFFFDFFRRDINDNAIVKAEILDSSLNPVAFSQAVSNSGIRMHLNPRVDFQLSDRNVLSIRTEFSTDTDHNGGIGQFSLPSQGYDSSEHEFEIHVTDTQVISARTVNQLRFGFERNRDEQVPVSLASALNVRGAFTGGGSSQGTSNVIQKHLEVNNMTSMSLGKHSVSFGGRLRNISQSNNSTQGFNGTFTFASLAAYQVVEQGLAQSLTVPQIISNCLATQDPANPDPAACGPSQFVLTAGSPLATVSRWDVGVYGEDEWRVRPNLSLTAGLRFESQNGIHDHADFAPRIGLAWGLGRSAKPQTVLRAGFGVFYDRFDDDYMLQADRLNGITEQRYVVNLPDFFPEIPSLATLAAANTTSPTVYRISPTLRAPYTMQTGVGLERQLGRSVTTSVTYVNSHGVHQLLTRNVNAPLPGTYDPLVPTSGTRPFGDIGNIYQYETAGLFNQNQLISNFNIRAGTKFSMNGFYTLSYAKSNAVGGGFPMNQYNIRQDYGPAPFIVRHQVFLGGSMGLPKGFRLSPFMMVSSGRPYNLTIGDDLNGDSIYNDRPAFAAAGATGPNIVSTPLGVFNVSPTANDTLVPPNYLFGPSQFSLNARLAKTFGFGKTREGGGGGPGGGWHSHDRGLGGRGLGSSGGGGPFGGPSADNHRYQLEFSIMGRNVFNKVNLAPPVGTLSSPFFGQSIAISSGFFGSPSAVRSLNLMMRFSF
ncbi:MAG TPA: hypothetical protein VFM21_02210, partial [Terriglobia bacterium]|nr:hypothetical protein [Terriglobia bacterium]